MKAVISFFLILFSVNSFAQVNKNDTIRVENYPTDSISAKKPKTETEVYADVQKANKPGTNPRFSPTKAGLYSAVLPGLGQYYNKKYWKIPVVYGAIGVGAGFIIYEQKWYKKYRNAFVAELNGQPHEFSDKPWMTREVLGRRQDEIQRYRDYAIAITGLLYILNIVDAVVDAHLYEGRHDPDLVLSPAVIYDQYSAAGMKTGLSFSFKF